MKEGNFSAGYSEDIERYEEEYRRGAHRNEELSLSVSSQFSTALIVLLYFVVEPDLIEDAVLGVHLNLAGKQLNLFSADLYPAVRLPKRVSSIVLMRDRGQQCERDRVLLRLE